MDDGLSSNCLKLSSTKTPLMWDSLEFQIGPFCHMGMQKELLKTTKSLIISLLLQIS